MTAGDTLPHLRDAPWLTQGPVRRLMDVLDRDGEEARVVGGAVRNALLGEPIGDIDVATTAVPQDVIRRVEQAGLKAVPTGIDHGTVTVVVDGRPFEVTTLREDVETFGRKAAVRFGRDWKADAERRDFTVNALSVSAGGTIHDDVGGLGDLQQRRVRFIGDAQVRIREDYLRILRFFRFHAAYGRGALDPDGLHAAIVLRDGLDRLSRERIRMELLKLLVAPGAAVTLAVMAESGILTQVLGAVPVVPRFQRMAVVETALDFTADPVRRLGALCVHVSEDAERLWQRLRLTNSEHDRLASMPDGWWGLSSRMEETAARALLYRLGPALYLDRVLFAWVSNRGEPADPAWRTLAELPQHWEIPKFPLRAAHFLKRGIARGPALGAALKAAEEAWVAADFPAGATAVAAIADSAAQAHR